MRRVSASATVSSWPVDRARSSCRTWRRRSSASVIRSSSGHSTRSSTSPNRVPVADPERDATVDYELGENRYGKSRIRLVTVRRDPDRHHLRDLTVAVALEGEFDDVHTRRDNAGVVATATMKNTVYAFARERLTGSPEAFRLDLASHFAGYEACRRAL